MIGMIGMIYAASRAPARTHAPTRMCARTHKTSQTSFRPFHTRRNPPFLPSTIITRTLPCGRIAGQVAPLTTPPGRRSQRPIIIAPSRRACIIPGSTPPTANRARHRRNRVTLIAQAQWFALVIDKIMNTSC